jgi:hypothetical protein
MYLGSAGFDFIQVCPGRIQVTARAGRSTPNIVRLGGNRCGGAGAAAKQQDDG